MKMMCTSESCERQLNMLFSGQRVACLLWTGNSKELWEQKSARQHIYSLLTQAIRLKHKKAYFPHTLVHQCFQLVSHSHSRQRRRCPEGSPSSSCFQSRFLKHFHVATRQTAHFCLLIIDENMSFFLFACTVHLHVATVVWAHASWKYGFQ